MACAAFGWFAADGASAAGPPAVPVPPAAANTVTLTEGCALQPGAYKSLVASGNLTLKHIQQYCVSGGVTPDVPCGPEAWLFNPELPGFSGWDTFNYGISVYAWTGGISFATMSGVWNRNGQTGNITDAGFGSGDLWASGQSAHTGVGYVSAIATIVAFTGNGGYCWATPTTVTYVH
jgi:hypothetical protein